MSAIQNLSPRDVMKGTALSRFMLGASVAAWSPVQQAVAGPADFAPDLFVAIASTGQVTIVVTRSKMGAGIRTSLAMIVADELDADWHDVRVEQAQGDAKYGDRNTDGSKSVRLLLNTMREAGATARLMLLTAAARRWNVAPSACHTEANAVVLGAAGKRLRYAELVDDAAKLPVPEATAVRVKSRAAWRYIGKPMPIVGLDDIVRGRAVYGIDVVLPGMKYASIERPPSYGSSVRSYDASDALKVPGVERVVQIPGMSPPSGFMPSGGVAVIASNTWAALQGRQQLHIDWEPAPDAGYDTTAYRAERAMMEPESCTAAFAAGGCTVWTATQNPQQARTTVAQVLGIDQSDVTVNITLLGGGFGRKSKPDYVAEAAFLARAVGEPVKVTWSRREDDLAHDYYHAITAQCESAAVVSIGNTLHGSLTSNNGLPEQSNLGDYQVPCIDSTPETHVYIVRSDTPRGGVGEPGVPPASAAICNGIFRAVGQRYARCRSTPRH